jgi:hypothetical protein
LSSDGLTEALTVMRLKIPPTLAHPALDERDRVDDRDLPGPLDQREAVERRRDGAALVRGRHRRTKQAVPQGGRLPPAPRLAQEPHACITEGVTPIDHNKEEEVA